MAQSATTPDVTMIVPGSYPTIKVERSPSGTAASGIVILVGEAEQGPDFSAEEDLAEAFYRPSQISAAVAKYGSGPLVNALQACATPASDRDITGSPTGFVVVKTNPSTKAQATFLRAGLTDYSIAADRSYGAKGNNIHFSVTDKVAEVAASVGPFALLPTPSGASVKMRVNGAAELSTTTGSLNSVPDIVGKVLSGSNTGLNALSGILVTGGVDRDVLNGLAGVRTLSVTAPTATTIVITLSGGAWATTPTVGDVLAIPGIPGDYDAVNASSIKGVNDADPALDDNNAGVYVVTAATSTTISATKKFNNGAGPLEACEAVAGPAVIPAEEDSIIVWSPVTITNITGTARPGVISAGMIGTTIAGAASGSSLVLTLGSGSWAVLPQVGDLCKLPSTAPAAWHASNTNGGWYSVAAVTSSTVTLTRLSNGSPSTFGATAIAATSDLEFYRKEIDGVGKSLEIYDGGGTDTLASSWLTLAGAAVSFLSTLATPVVNVSSAERKASISASRASDNVTGVFNGGGTVALTVGYYGTTATLEIAGNDLTTTVTGGTGGNLALKLSNYATIKDLADFINAQTGYTCSAATTAAGQNSPTVLDEGTFGICGGFDGSKTGRIKRDAYDIWKALEGSSLLQFGIDTTSTAADSGLPENQADTFLANGAKGATTNLEIAAALDACELVDGNFVVPLFARDAADDILDDMTDASSTYTIDSIHALAKTHVLQMSEVKYQKNRQAILAFKGSFADAKTKAADLAHPRCSLVFQDFKALNASGTITQFQPWMGAALAASMQSAGFYRAIVKKGINCSGVLQAAADFDARKIGDKEEALLAGLLCAERDPRLGGFRWISDQTTYLSDNNFVYNSIQAVYAADLVALTTARELEAAFVGQSLADVTSAVMTAYTKGIFANLKRLKLLAASDGAEGGYRNLTIDIQGPVAYVSAEIFLATALYFIPIQFKVVQVESASA